MPTRRLLLLSACFATSACYAPEQEQPPIPDFVVLFHGDSDALDPAATRIVEEAAALAKTASDKAVRVEGYADRSATPQSNQILSRLRAQAVANALVRLGVEKARIHIRPKTAIGGDPGVESRRVEIVIGR